MKKFQFSLDHVRDYRDRLLDEETGKLQRLRAEQTRIEQLIAQLEADFAQVSKAMRDAQAEGITALEQRGFSLQLESIRMQTHELTDLLKGVQDQVEQQTQIVVAANQEVSKLDKLKDRQYEDWQTSVRKAEEERIEELVSRIISAKQPDNVLAIPLKGGDKNATDFNQSAERNFRGKPETEDGSFGCTSVD